MQRPPLDVSYLDAAPGRWKWATWAIFALAAIAYFVGFGTLFIYLTYRLGFVAGALLLGALFFVAVPLFKAGMRARRRKPA